MIDIHFIGFEDQLKDIESRLQGVAKPERVLTNAINQAARRVRKQIVQNAKGEYALSDKAVLKLSEVKLKAAKPTTGVAEMTSKGAVNDLMSFLVSPKAPEHDYTKNVAYVAKVLSGSGMKPLNLNPKPFVTQFKSGHIAIVQRVPGSHMKSDPTKEAVKKLLSPAVPHMMKNEEVSGQAQELFFAELPDAISKAIGNTLAKAAKR